ncbi:MAG: deoxyribodipyrimidine photo-lyase, partial [Planktotalea arctica]
MTTLLWLKRDLRVHDHPALARAASFGAPVVPLYVIEPEYWALPDTSARQWGFTRECLGSVAEEFAGLGAPLVVEQGDAVECLARTAQRFGVTRIVSHEETGNLWTFQRDMRVKAWARAQGIK